MGIGEKLDDEMSAFVSGFTSRGDCGPIEQIGRSIVTANTQGRASVNGRRTAVWFQDNVRYRSAGRGLRLANGPGQRSSAAVSGFRTKNDNGHNILFMACHITLIGVKAL